MHAIRVSFLIVSFFFISICSHKQKRTNINQSLFITSEITFDCHTLNSERDSGSDLASNNRCDNISIKVKATPPILMITELDADDLLFKPYILSAL